MMCTMFSYTHATVLFFFHQVMFLVHCIYSELYFIVRIFFKVKPALNILFNNFYFSSLKGVINFERYGFTRNKKITGMYEKIRVCLVIFEGTL